MFKNLIRIFKETLFPNGLTCDICGVETFNGNLCADCLKTVKFNDGNFCPVCGRKTVRPEICGECKAHLPLFNKGVSPLVYKDGSSALIHKFKNGNGYLKEYFADLICERLRLLPVADRIVYVPVTPYTRRKRGYNQDKLLAYSISERTGIPVIKNCVVKVKETGEQKELSRIARVKNLKGCFKVVKPNEVKDRSLLLVDDVLTTGATADEMTKVLFKAGATAVYLAVIAAVEFGLCGKKSTA